MAKPRYDFKTTPSQSAHMKQIGSKNTGCEMILRKELWKSGFRYRLHRKDLPGKPDLIFSRYNLVVFVDGDFWHGFRWEERKLKIASNREYWIQKIEGNMARDKINNSKLRKLGFTVLRFWEHDILNNPKLCVAKIEKRLLARSK